MSVAGEDGPAVGVSWLVRRGDGDGRVHIHGHTASARTYVGNTAGSFGVSSACRLIRAVRGPVQRHDARRGGYAGGESEQEQ